MFSGRITPRVIASRSSAADLPEKSSREAALPAAAPLWRARFSAVCWRPRARPPAEAARRCEALLRVVPERDELELEREDVLLRVERDVEREELERDELDPEERLARLDPPPLEDPDLRAEELDLRVQIPEHHRAALSTLGQWTDDEYRDLLS